MRRRRFLVLAALLVAVLAGVGSICSEWQRRHQATLDAALDHALEYGDLNRIERLVRRGAMPRTPEQAESMLLSAISGGKVALVRRLLIHGAMIPEHNPVDPGQGEALEDGLQYNYRDEESVLGQAATIPSRIPAGYLALGRYQYRRGEFEAAARSFDAAQRLDHHDPAIERAYATARRKAALSEAISAQLSPGLSVIALESLSGTGATGRWVALAAYVHRQANSRFTGLRLLLVDLKGSDCWILWRSLPLVDPRFEHSGFDAVGLRVEDLSGEGHPQVIVSKLFMGASWRPSHLNLFQPEGDRLVQRLGITSSEGFELVRLGGPGRGQIRNSFEIGWGLSHVEQPRWQSIYGWDGHRFRLVDDLYPNESRDWPDDLRNILKDHPEDPELLL